MPPPLSTLLLILFLLALQAAANTEIRNFHVGLSGATSEFEGVRGAALLSTTHSGSGSGSGVHTLNATWNERVFGVRPAKLGTPLLAVCEPVGDDGDDGGGDGGVGDGDGDDGVGVGVGDGDGDGVRDVETGPCPYELWLALDVDDASWTRFTKFTIRISWPAFYPTDFDIALYSPRALGMHLLRTDRTDRTEGVPLGSSSSDGESSLKVSSRSKYARIRLVDTGVRPPSSSPPSSGQTAEVVPFTVILEPLLFGVLPATIVPTILFLIPVLAGVAFLLPYVMRYLEHVAAEARRELYGSEKPKLR